MKWKTVFWTCISLLLLGLTITSAQAYSPFRNDLKHFIQRGTPAVKTVDYASVVYGFDRFGGPLYYNDTRLFDPLYLSYNTFTPYYQGEERRGGWLQMPDERDGRYKTYAPKHTFDPSKSQAVYELRNSFKERFVMVNGTTCGYYKPLYSNYAYPACDPDLNLEPHVWRPASVAGYPRPLVNYKYYDSPPPGNPKNYVPFGANL